jgi:hypothetical protein
MSMKLTKNELKELNEFAELLYTDSELAEILEVKPVELKAELMREGSDIARVITAARYRKRSQLRKAIIKMAINGSTPAMNQVNELLKKLEN